jgi:O-antigen/teichoic acid export membrane protein
MLLIAVCLIAGGAQLGREFFRITLIAYRRPLEVLRADAAYVAVLVAGAYLATLTPQPALAAIAFVVIASVIGLAILRGGLWSHEPWNPRSSERVFTKIFKTGAWAITGAGIHWLLIQGYSYLVAGILDVKSIAAIAGTRLTLMPVFVLSGGVSMLLFPITSRWVHELGVSVAVRRLVLLVAALAALALVYMVAMWLGRDWIFSALLKKSFPARDSLLLLWSAVFLVTLCRDQLATLPASRGRFRDMTLITGFSAVVWLLASYLALTRFGPPGAVGGILVGEVVNILGIIVLIFRETHQPA